MGARNKLNKVAMTGVLVLSGLIGFMARSLAAFLIALAVLTLLGVLAGDIRLSGRNRRR